MPKATYRVYGEGRWQSMSGNAILALYNKPGSGKKVDIQSIEVYPQTRTTGSWTATLPNLVQIDRVTNVGTGRAITPKKMDTDAPDVPSQIEIETGSSCVVQSRIYQLILKKCMVPGTAMCGLVQLNNAGVLASGQRASSALNQFIPGWKTTIHEPITLREGESLALLSQAYNESMPVEVFLIFELDFSPPRTYYAETIATLSPNSTLTIENKSGSGRILKVRQITIQELGTFDTPYLQIVPIGTMDPIALTDPVAKVSFAKMDTNSPTPPTSMLEIYQDVQFLPRDVPVSYLADASAGSPKGYNYLQTKDFIGPLYQTFFPEMRTKNPGGAVDDLGTTMSMKWACIKGRGAPISVRAGEGIAIVSAAETAVIATTVGTSGCVALEFGITFTIESAVILKMVVKNEAGDPVVGAFAYIDDSDVAPYIMNTTTDVNGEASVAYEGSPASDTRWRVRKYGYKNFKQLIDIGGDNISLPITLVVDPQQT